MLMTICVIGFGFGVLATLGGCLEGIGYAIVFGIPLLIQIMVENRVNNYDISKVDDSKMMSDVARGVGTEEIKRNMINGKYDMKK